MIWKFVWTKSFVFGMIIHFLSLSFFRPNAKIDWMNGGVTYVQQLVPKWNRWLCVPVRAYINPVPFSWPTVQRQPLAIALSNRYYCQPGSKWKPLKVHKKKNKKQNCQNDRQMRNILKLVSCIVSHFSAEAKKFNTEIIKQWYVIFGCVRPWIQYRTTWHDGSLKQSTRCWRYQMKIDARTSYG